MARRTQAQWQSLIQQFEQSGLSQVAFCQQHQLNPTYFSLRRSKLRAMKAMPASRFVEASPMTPDRPEMITVQYGAVSIQILTSSTPMIVSLVKALAS